MMDTQIQAPPPIPSIRSTTSRLTQANRWDHILARWAVNREGHRVEPGLYALGNPSPDSPVLVTANYTLSFDAVRANLAGFDAYILVLDTQGVNVWCAAGKGTFGTNELVQRIETSGVKQMVSHRKLILPQLGAPGIAAFEVTKRTAFKVEYGPVRAADLPAYLRSHIATPEMRRVRFDLRDRITLIPVELVYVLPLFLLFILTGGVSVISAILSGVVLFPILLPWLPTHNFTTKGWILGLLTSLPFALRSFLGSAEVALWMRAGSAAAMLLILPVITAYLALNFTGSTSFTSRTGVRNEIFAYIPALAWSLGIGIALLLLLTVVKA